MKYRLFLILTFSLLLPFKSIAEPAQIKILPLGDSITGASKYKQSYRYPLWQHLVDAGKSIRFIGSQFKEGNHGRVWANYKNLKFPEANEAHSGWRADQVLGGLNRKIRGIDQWIKTYTPDIALIHLGTNDMYQSQTPESTRDEIEQIIIILRKKNPRIKILVAKIIPLRMKPNVPRLNQLLGQLAVKLNTKTSPVMAADLYSGFSIYTDMQKDKIHPNANGEKKMAKAWFNALMKPQFLGK
ncbi:MAG: hypothetical protein KAG28_10500 [Cocleimonas sp.]|nr:hypothetical protein [Cocleimonas sp.]